MPCWQSTEGYGRLREAAGTQIPLLPVSLGQHRGDDATRCGGMDEPIAADVDANVGYRSAVCLEEDKVAWLQAVDDALTNGIELRGSSRQGDAESLVTVTHEP